MRERGLKQEPLHHQTRYLRVAPHAGAWVETGTAEKSGALIAVAPHAGAWVETAVALYLLSRQEKSLPMRERGLKLCRLGQSRFA